MRGEDQVALFHWAVNFGVEQLCVWQHPLAVVWPQRAQSPSYEVPTTWPGWPHGQLAVFPGTTHFFGMARTALVLDVVQTFLDAPMPEA